MGRGGRADGDAPVRGRDRARPVQPAAAAAAPARCAIGSRPAAEQRNQMKRLILAVAGTIAGLIALLSFQTHAGPAAVGSLPAASLGPGPSPTSGGPGAVTTLGQTVHTQFDTIQVRIVTAGGR